MYKDFRRASRKIPDEDVRSDLRKQIISEFRNNKDKNDGAAIKGLLGEGIRSLARLRSMVPSNSISDPIPEPTTDETDETDLRVGKGWPWSR